VRFVIGLASLLRVGIGVERLELPAGSASRSILQLVPVLGGEHCFHARVSRGDVGRVSLDGARGSSIAGGEVEQLVESHAVERHALGGRLHLDELASPVMTTFRSTSAVESSVYSRSRSGSPSTTLDDTAATEPLMAFARPKRSSAQVRAT
jgi:hypothetical protein